MPQYIAIGPNGDRKAWNGSAWVTMPAEKAPGAAYLPENYGVPDKSEAAYFNGWRKERDPSVKSAESSLAAAREMEGLMSKQKTGGIYGVPVIGDVAGFMDPEIRRMEGLSSASARSARQPGEGTISDYDAKMFLAQTFGKDKPTETNRMILTAQRQAADAAIQQRAFNDWYYQTFGNRVGADEAWMRYAEDNPIFDPGSEAAGAPRLNTGRQNWRQYFGAVRGPGDNRGTQAQADIERSAGRKTPNLGAMTPKQRAAIKMFAGSKEQPGMRGNPYVPVSDDEAKKIPPGAWILDEDGTIFQKPGGR